MLSYCPHCHQDLALSPAQKQKIETALAALPSGKTLKIACPKCRQPMELQATGGAGGLEILKDVLYSEHTGDEDLAAMGIVQSYQKRPQPTRMPPLAPKPPDISWLASGEYQAKEVIEDVPRVLILAADQRVSAAVTGAFTGLGYLPTSVRSAEEAIDKMRFMSFDAVVLHSRFEGGGVDDSLFHRHMGEMAMDRRRTLLYVLVGPEFQTLYDLEALAHSANLVVNDRDADQLALILKKAQYDHAQLFGPFLEVLKQYGVK